ncbi:MAG: GNAT family N-acetyltransferase, partial [Verrucomicrobia bacterium]|nr:GNAT family N-acetyltransferase [Verrucomicrobiota bacterium]
MLPRVLHPSDAAIYQALRLRGLREEPRAFSPTFEEEAGLTMEEVSAALTPTGERLVLGLFDGDQLVGLAGVARERPSKLAHRATVWGVYVAPEARGRGAGKVLMQAAVEHAYALPGIRQLYLSVQEANSPARRLYESLGFE